MLPDFPRQKELLRQELDRWIRNEVRRRSGPFGAVRREIQHEGSRWLLVREDGTTDSGGYATATSSIELDNTRVPDMSKDEVYKLLNGLVDDISRQQFRHFLSRIEQTCTASGNVVDAEGQPLTAELILHVLEKLQIEFDDNGEPRLPVMLVGPEVAEKIKGRIPEWEKDANLKRKYEELITRKRGEWRDRQARRKLVD